MTFQIISHWMFRPQQKACRSCAD